MLRAFKKMTFFSPTLMAVLVLLMSAKVFGGLSMPASEDTMSYFHDNERQAQVVDQFGIDAAEQNIHFEIYFINTFGEPHSEPIKIVIGYQAYGQSYRRLKRVFDSQDEASYCNYGLPQIMSRGSFAEEVGLSAEDVHAAKSLTSPGEYLIVPVFRADENSGQCLLDKPEFEVFSIEEISDRK